MLHNNYARCCVDLSFFFLKLNRSFLPSCNELWLSLVQVLFFITPIFFSRKIAKYPNPKKRLRFTPTWGFLQRVANYPDGVVRNVVNHPMG